MPSVSREVGLHAPALVVGVFDRHDVALLAHHRPGALLDRSHVFEFARHAVTARKLEGEQLVLDGEAGFRPGGVVLDDTADDGGVFGEDDAAAEVRTAVRLHEVADVRRGRDEHRVTDLQRYCTSRVDVLGDRSVPARNRYLRVRNRLFRAVFGDDETLVRQEEPTRGPRRTGD